MTVIRRDHRDLWKTWLVHWIRLALWRCAYLLLVCSPRSAFEPLCSRPNFQSPQFAEDRINLGKRLPPLRVALSA
jgi:hypothetical protein